MVEAALHGFQRAGGNADSTLRACFPVYRHLCQAEALEDPGDDAEGADELAEGPVDENGRDGKKSDGQSNGDYGEFEIEEVKRINVVVDNHSFFRAHNRCDDKDKKNKQDDPHRVGDLERELFFTKFLYFLAQRQFEQQFLQDTESAAPPTDNLVSHDSQQAEKTKGENKR